MALRDDIISLTFGAGIETKIDKVLVPDGKLLALQDAVWTNLGSIQKRFGHDALPQVDQSGSLITSGTFLSALGDELVLGAQGLLYGYSPSLNRWISRGPVPAAEVAERPVSRGNSSRTVPDSSVVQGCGVYAWEDSQGGVWATVLDEQTGASLVPSTQLSGLGQAPRVVVAGGKAKVVAYVSGSPGSLSSWTFDPAHPSLGIVPGPRLDANPIAGPVFDIRPCRGGTYVALAYERAVDNQIEAVILNAGFFQISSTVIGGDYGSGQGNVSALSVADDGPYFAVTAAQRSFGYLIPDGPNTVVHVNGTDLHNGTAAVGPVWQLSGTVPFSASANPPVQPIPSVGPFYTGSVSNYSAWLTASGHFQLGPGNPLNFSSSFCITIVYSAPDANTSGLSSNGAVLLSTTDSVDNGFWIYQAEPGLGFAIYSPNASGPNAEDPGAQGGDGVGAGIVAGGSGIFWTFPNQIVPVSQGGNGGGEFVNFNLTFPPPSPYPLNVVFVGFNAANNEMFIRVNGQPAFTGSLGGALADPSTNSPFTYLGAYQHQFERPNGIYPLAGQIYELWASTDTPSDALFSQIYGQIQTNVSAAFAGSDLAAFPVETFFVSSGSCQLSSSVLVAQGSAPIPQVTSVALPSTSSVQNIFVAFQQEPFVDATGSFTDRQIQEGVAPFVNGSSLAPPLSSGILARGVGLVGEAFTYGGGAYLLSVLTSSVQQTYFLLDASGNPLAKAYYQNAGGIPIRPRLTQFTVSGSTAHSAVSIQTRVVTNNGELTSVSGIDELELTFGQLTSNGILGTDLIVADGLPSSYDGVQVTEQGFCAYPETPALSLVNGYPGLIVVSASYLIGFGSQQLTAQLSFPIVNDPKTVNQLGQDLQFDGQLIRPGSYWTFGGQYGPESEPGGPEGSGFLTGSTYFWYQVDGSGTDPRTAQSFSPFWTGSMVAVSSTDSAYALAYKTWLALSSSVLCTNYPGLGNVPYGTPLSITTPLTGGAVSNTILMQWQNHFNVSWPCWDWQFTVSNTTTPGSNPDRINQMTAFCTSGTLIQGGQYFVFDVFPTTGSYPGTTEDVPLYIWFQVDGSGSDPRATSWVGGLPTGVKVPIQSSYTAFQVAQAVSASIAASIWASTQAIQVEALQGPYVILDTYQKGTTLYPGLIPGYNPIVGGVGRTFLGTGDGVSVAGAAGGLVPFTTTNAASTASQPTWAVGTGGPNPIGAAGMVPPQPVVDLYGYSNIFEWIDGSGQLCRSADGVPGEIGVPQWPTMDMLNSQPGQPAFASPTDAVVEVVSDTLRLTRKPNVDLAIYRSQGNQTPPVYQRATSPIALLPAPRTQDLVSFTDRVSDLALSTNDILYTVGGILANEQAPACTISWVHQDRMWLGGLEDPQLLWFSQQYRAGTGIQFSSELTLRIDPSLGPVVALATLDLNLIVFTSRGIWLIQGPGPTSNGTGGNPFSTPQAISSTVGCRDPGSVVLLPNGLLFKSDKGWFLLDRGLQTHPEIGLPVFGFNADVCVSAQIVPGTTQVRCLSEDGTTLVYDWLYNFWGTFSTAGLDSTTLPDGTYRLVQPNGQVWEEVSGSFSDPGNNGYPMLVTTNWIHLGNVQGYQHLSRARFLGFFSGSQGLRVTAEYDFGAPLYAPVTSSFTLNSGSGDPQSVWGSDPTWGTSTPWGSPISSASYHDLLQFKFTPQWSECQAFRFTLTDLAPYPTGGSWKLTSAEFEVGLESGGWRVPDAAGIG